MAKAQAKKPTAPDDDGHLRIEGTLLWKWRALDAEARAAQSELESLVTLIQAEIAKNPMLSDYVQRKAALMGTLGTARTELFTVQAEIEKVMGVSLKECSFDDKTGRLYHLGQDGSRGEPLKQARKLSRKKGNDHGSTQVSVRERNRGLL